MKESLLDSDVLVNSENADLDEIKIEIQMEETKLEPETKLESEPEFESETEAESDPGDSWFSELDYTHNNDGSISFFTDQSSEMIFTKDFCREGFLSSKDLKKLFEACNKLNKCNIVFDVADVANSRKINVSLPEDVSDNSENEDYSDSESESDNDNNNDDEECCNTESESNNENESVSSEVTIEEPKTTKLSNVLLSSYSEVTFENIKKNNKNPFLASVWKHNTLEDFMENNKDITEEDLELIKNLYNSDKDSREGFLLQNSFFEA